MQDEISLDVQNDLDYMNQSNASRWKSCSASVVSKMADNVDAELSEDLDYHITFPSPTPDDVSDEEILEYYNVGAVEKEPVVILLGWLGCQEKHLAKYSAIYEHKKCITISYTLSTDKVFSEKVRESAVKVLEMIEDLSLEENPIMFHVMSNAGAILYCSICEVLRSDPQFSKLKVRGSVFDSTPCKKRIGAAIKALSTSLPPRNPIVNLLITFIFSLLIIGKYFFTQIARLLGLAVDDGDCHESLANDPSEWPQLYLYSKADKIVSYHDIDELIARRRKRGFLIFSLCWEDSEHVSHFRTHRETYLKQCYDFLDICTAVDESESI